MKTLFNMKLINTLLAMLFAFQVGYAQTEDLPEPPDQKAKDKINAARIAFITEKLGLTPAEAEKFWPVYREFAQKRQQLQQQYREAQRAGKSDKELVELGLQLKQQELDLEKNYSGRLMESISPQKLMALRQAEADFRKIVLQQIKQRQNMQNNREMQRERIQQRQQQRNN
jgi:hypothetical protein